MPETTTPAKKTPAKTKTAEVVRWAYVLTDDGKSYKDAVTFGNDAARTAFLREHSTEWWRILDATKGVSLTESLAATS
jgi:hypothetical protein